MYYVTRIIHMAVDFFAITCDSLWNNPKLWPFHFVCAIA